MKSKKQLFLEELAFAMEQTSYQAKYYLDRETMDLILHSDDVPIMFDDEEYDEIMAEKAQGVNVFPEWQMAEIRLFEPGRHILIEPMPAYQSFEIMENFVEEKVSGSLKRRLLDALQRKHPFRNFKNVIEDYEDVRQLWHDYKEALLVEKAKNWLVEQGIDIDKVELP